MLSRRELLGYSAVIALGYSGLSSGKKPSFERLLDTKPYGNVSLIFTSDIHGHLKPVYFPEPMNLIAPENLKGTPGFLAGMDFLKYYNLKPNTLEAYTMTCMSFLRLAKEYGKTGGAPRWQRL